MARFAQSTAFLFCVLVLMGAGWGMTQPLSKIAVSDAILKLPLKLDSRHITWCTYTDPEVAHVGLSREEARERGHDVETIPIPLADVDRAVLESAGSRIERGEQRGRHEPPVILVSRGIVDNDDRDQAGIAGRGKAGETRYVARRIARGAGLARRACLAGHPVIFDTRRFAGA